VLPGIVRLVEHDPTRTVFTRFITPNIAEDRPGRWQRYFRRWDCATRSRLPADALNLVSPLPRFVPPATLIDKPAYSAFFESGLTGVLGRKAN
jgi:nicotinamidase-related amidase